MIRVAWSGHFKRSFKRFSRSNPELVPVFWERIESFINNPMAPELRNHKLTGKLAEYRSFSIAYDLRVLYSEMEDGTAILHDIGTHDEVY